jgi:hypothetical protein
MTGKRLLRYFCIIVFLQVSASPWALKAQDLVSNWRSFSWQIGLGQTYLYDEYLSPLSHEGPSLRLSLSSMKGMNQKKYESEGIVRTIGSDDILCDQGRWYSCPSFTFTPAYTQSVGNTVFMYANIDIRETLLKNLYCNNRLSLAVGGYAALNGGLRYCPSNGNNPASADIMGDLGISAKADYLLPTPKLNIRFHYQGSFGLVGLAFSPEYAESYYEIFYLGNHNNVVKFTAPHNMQRWSHQISADFPMKKRQSSFRLSYNNEGRVSTLNELRIRTLSNNFSIGYIRYFSTL